MIEMMFLLNELKIELMRTYGISTKNPLIRNKIRKEIARIKTKQNQNANNKLNTIRERGRSK